MVLLMGVWGKWYLQVREGICAIFDIPAPFYIHYVLTPLDELGSVCQDLRLVCQVAPCTVRAELTVAPADYPKGRRA
jgi:hypothetical protein